MNKIKILLIGIPILLFLFGCGKKATEIPYTQHTARAFGYSASAKYPLATLNTSRAELNAYIESFNYIYSSDTVGQTALADATAKYDDNFFKSKALILVLLQEPSSSITHTTNMILKSGSIFTVEISRNVPAMGSSDMALWQMIFEVDQNVIKTGDSVQVSITQ